jgi:hypothetical protein
MNLATLTVDQVELSVRTTAVLKRAMPGASLALIEAADLTRLGLSKKSVTEVRDMLAMVRDAPDDSLPELTPATYQDRVKDWILACFNGDILADGLERGDRLLEEVFELLQSKGYPEDRIPMLQRYVYDREPGEPAQEVGGVMVTLAGFCACHGLDMHRDGETELARVWTKVDAIREKQKAKPKGSRLPPAHDPRRVQAGRREGRLPGHEHGPKEHQLRRRGTGRGLQAADGHRPGHQGAHRRRVARHAGGFGMTATGTDLRQAFIELASTLPSPTYNPPQELVVVENGQHAAAIGFSPSGRHRQHEHIRVWWPSRGPGELHGDSLARVTIAPYVQIDSGTRQMLRRRMDRFGANAVWLEF